MACLPVLAASIVEGGAGYTVLPAQLRGRSAGVGLFPQLQDWVLTRSRLLNADLVGAHYENIPLISAALSRMDYY